MYVFSFYFKGLSLFFCYQNRTPSFFLHSDVTLPQPIQALYVLKQKNEEQSYSVFRSCLRITRKSTQPHHLNELCTLCTDIILDVAERHVLACCIRETVQ